MEMRDALEYYRAPGRMTSLERHMDFVRWLTGDVRAICHVVQGLIVHDSWLDEYGTDLDRHRLVSPFVTASDILDMAVGLSSRHLAISRSPQERVIGCCREFALLTCAILRRASLPVAGAASRPILLTPATLGTTGSASTGMAKGGL